VAMLLAELANLTRYTCWPFCHMSYDLAAK